MKFTNYNLFRSDLYEHGLEYAAEHSVRLGFDSVELLDIMTSSKPSLLEIPDLPKAKAILDSYGLEVSCYSVAAQLYCEAPQPIVEALYRHAELAAALGSPYFHHTLVLSKPANAPTYNEVFKGIVASAQNVATHCKSLGLVTLYEPQGRYFNGIEGLGRFYEAMKACGAPIGICGDLGNSLFVDVSPTDVTRAFANEIRHVHVKDYILSHEPFADRTCRQTARGNWLAECELGRGIVDLRACFELLRRADYTGAISFEITENDEKMTDAIAYIKALLS